LPPRGLEDSDLEYLRDRLFGGVVRENYDVTMSLFTTDNLQMCGQPPGSTCSFSFWVWFFSIAEMIQDRPGQDYKVGSLWNRR
jgi:hypothetical protein